MNFFNRKNQKKNCISNLYFSYYCNGFAYGLRVFSKIVHRRGYKGRLFYKVEWTALLLFAFVDSEIAAWRSAIHRKTLTLHFPG